MKKLFLTAGFIIFLTAGAHAAPGESSTVITYRDAINAGNMAAIQQIIEYGQFSDPVNDPIFADGQTPLMLAVQKDNPKLVKYFVKQGADATIKDNNGKTALMYAQEKNYRNLYRILRWSEAKHKPKTDTAPSKKK